MALFCHSATLAIQPAIPTEYQGVFIPQPFSYHVGRLPPNSLIPFQVSHFSVFLSTVSLNHKQNGTLSKLTGIL